MFTLDMARPRPHEEDPPPGERVAPEVRWGRITMAKLNHHIVHARDPEASARFLTEIMGLPAPSRFGPFVVVHVENDVSLDFLGTDDEKYLVPNHYAFLVSEPEFDEIWARIKARGLDYYADPAGREKGSINHHFGGRGLYWADPDGHWLEIITRPYGSSD